MYEEGRPALILGKNWGGKSRKLEAPTLVNAEIDPANNID